MTININPEKLAQFEQLFLHEGAHDDFDEGHCAMEVVAWLADEGHTDAPHCASPVLRRYTIALNDRWDDEKRQQLKPYLLRMIGTGSDGKDELREQIAAKWVSQRLLGPWLRLAGLTEHADALETSTNVPEIRRAIRAARDAAWALHRKRYDLVKEKVKEQLLERLAKKPAVAVADAVAVAAADAVADAAAVAVADAVAGADAVADAAADAVAAAVADAVAAADAVADAVAVAVADADADAVTVADAVTDAVADADAAADADVTPYSKGWWKVRRAAYNAARNYYRDNPLPITREIADLAASQQGAALELLEELIDPAPEAQS